MEDLITIWTPVIISKLISAHKTQEHIIYQLDQIFNVLEDVKIKVKQAKARIYGKGAEVTIKFELLCLVQDMNGDMQLVSREEKLVHIIPASRFSHHFTREQDPSFAVNITSLKWEGEIKGRELKIGYGLDYIILVLQDRAVKLSTENSIEVQGDITEEIMGHHEEELDRIREEKEELLQKIFYYERDITSLKKSISKTEKRNTTLSYEVTRNQQLIQQLQKAMRDKETRINNDAHYSYWRRTEEQAPDSDSSRGSWLKRMFIISL